MSHIDATLVAVLIGLLLVLGLIVSGQADQVVQLYVMGS